MRALCLAMAVVLGAVGAGQAATLSFDSRAAFLAATGPAQGLDFNGFSAEAFFDTAPLDLGPFSVGTDGGIVLTGGGVRRNLLDLPATAPRSLDIDATAQLNVLIQRGHSFRIVFDRPTTAFGADFRQFNEVPRVLVALDGGAGLAPSTVAGTRFFGLVSDVAFTTLTFIALRSDNFGLDNALFVSAIPLPASLPLLLGALVLLGGLRRRPV